MAKKKSLVSRGKKAIKSTKKFMKRHHVAERGRAAAARGKEFAIQKRTIPTWALVGAGAVAVFLIYKSYKAGKTASQDVQGLVVSKAY